MKALDRRLLRLEQRQDVLTLPTTPVTVQSPADVVSLIEATVNDVRAGRLDPRTAVVIGSLAGVALKAMEVGDLADQLDALTAVLAPDKRRRIPERRR